MRSIYVDFQLFEYDDDRNEAAYAALDRTHTGCSYNLSIAMPIRCIELVEKPGSQYMHKVH